MKYYPAFLRVAGRQCLVIGGGRIAQQKVESLREAGALVTVISPHLTPTLAALATADAIVHRQRPYAAGDVRGFFLAVAATDDPGVHSRIAGDAEAAGVLLNVVDQPQLCTFIAPSVMQRGDLLIATSTSGTSPALAKRIRADLARHFGPEYDFALRLLGRLRQHLAATAVSAAQRQRIFSTLVDSPLLEYLRSGRAHEVDRLLAETAGAAVSLASLGLELS